MKSSNILLLMAATASAQSRKPGEIGVTLYEHAEFNSDGVGWSGFFASGAHTGDFPNDVVTSYMIDENCCATMYEHYDYLGQSYSECGPVKSSVPDNWNDVISSMKVECFMRNNGKDTGILGDGDMKIDSTTRNRLGELEKLHWAEEAK